MYYVFTPYIANIMVQHEDCILPISTDFDLLTNYSSMIIILLQTERNVFINDLNYLTKYNPMKSFILQNRENEVTTTGTITRV